MVLPGQAKDGKSRDFHPAKGRPLVHSTPIPIACLLFVATRRAAVRNSLRSWLNPELPLPLLGAGEAVFPLACRLSLPFHQKPCFRSQEAESHRASSTEHCPCPPGRRTAGRGRFWRRERQGQEKYPRHTPKGGQFQVLGFCGETKPPRSRARGSTEHGRPNWTLQFEAVGYTFPAWRKLKTEIPGHTEFPDSYNYAWRHHG